MQFFFLLLFSHSPIVFHIKYNSLSGLKFSKLCDCFCSKVSVVFVIIFQPCFLLKRSYTFQSSWFRTQSYPKIYVPTKTKVSFFGSLKASYFSYSFKITWHYILQIFCEKVTLTGRSEGVLFYLRLSRSFYSFKYYFVFL